MYVGRRFDLQEDQADVLADDAQADELHRTHEEDHDDRAGPAARAPCALDQASTRTQTEQHHGEQRPCQSPGRSPGAAGSC